MYLALIADVIDSKMVWYINPDFNGTQRCGGFNAVETVGTRTCT